MENKKLILKEMKEWRSNIDPTFVIGKDDKLIPVFVEHLDSDNVEIYMDNDNYLRVDHTKSYIFVHNPNAMDSHVPHIMKFVNVQIERNLDVNDLSKHHMHMEPS